jgi:hypothetical protein
MVRAWSAKRPRVFIAALAARLGGYVAIDRAHDGETLLGAPDFASLIRATHASAPHLREPVFYDFAS